MLVGRGSVQAVTAVGDIRVSEGAPGNLTIKVNVKPQATKLYRFVAHPNGTLAKK